MAGDNILKQVFKKIYICNSDFYVSHFELQKYLKTGWINLQPATQKSPYTNSLSRRFLYLAGRLSQTTAQASYQFENVFVECLKFCIYLLIPLKPAQMLQAVG